MDDELFKELVENVKEGGAILRGERPPGRVTTFHPDGSVTVTYPDRLGEAPAKPEPPDPT